MEITIDIEKEIEGLDEFIDLEKIEEYIKSNKKKTSSISLDLLEDDDLKKHELPVYKTLIKKKQD